ncbi:MAG: hypothetical protein P1U56_08995 [Saprospiraceae bacterium]|nr:hypothetical protein [Saprospiraceae bacterium]
MWFNKLMGFEESSESVRNHLKVEGNKLISTANQKAYIYGRLEVPTLSELISNAPNIDAFNEIISVKEVVGNVQHLHKDPANEHALFQAASQFNLLEMVGPGVSPERGVDIYETDYTQGPACAIACGAGTIFRNYFAEVNGKIGQSRYNQIDCLDLIAEKLDNEHLKMWSMVNGYALFNGDGLIGLNIKLDQLSSDEREQLKQQLKIGLQWDTQVTLDQCTHLVSQAYCSALPVSYCNEPHGLWEKFARIILEATYEATLYAALINYKNTGSKDVYLTLVGGGAFGNRMEWIITSMQIALEKFKNTPLDVKIVSFSRSSSAVQNMINSLSS